jgi:hypothetical protein
MVKMGNVWDRTGEVLNGRGGMLAGIAILTLFVPAAIQAAVVAYSQPGRTTTLIGVALSIAVAIAALWGQLAIIAASTDSTTGRAAAQRQASARLPAALLVAIVLALIFLVAFLPAAGLMVAAGMDFSRMASGVPSTPTAYGPLYLALLYILVVLITALFLGARMLPLYAVVLHERLGVGAIRRSWQLTRRHTWRLVGVVLLFLVVLLIATWAAQSVVGLIVRLILGGDAVATVTFVASLAGQAVSTGLTLVAIVFSAQLYVALTTREQRLQERSAQNGLGA